MNRVWTGFIGSIVEAWAELRIHKTRVLLSLIGVAVAVAALTDVVALGQIAEQSQREQSERWGGRPAMLGDVAPTTRSGASARTRRTSTRPSTRSMDRYQISYTSRNQGGSLLHPVPVRRSGDQRAGGRRRLRHDAPGPARRGAVVHRRRRTCGSRPRSSSTRRSGSSSARLRSPPIRRSPSPANSRPPRSSSARSPTRPSGDTWPQLFILSSAWQRIMPPNMTCRCTVRRATRRGCPPTRGRADRCSSSATSPDALGEGWQVDVFRNDYLARSSTTRSPRSRS